MNLCLYKDACSWGKRKRVDYNFDDNEVLKKDLAKGIASRNPIKTTLAVVFSIAGAIMIATAFLIETPYFLALIVGGSVIGGIGLILWIGFGQAKWKSLSFLKQLDDDKKPVKAGEIEEKIIAQQQRMLFDVLSSAAVKPEPDPELNQVL